MKTLPLLLLVFLAGALLSPAKSKQKALILVCQGTEEFSRDNPRAEQVLLLREEMSSLIKEGNIPIVIECDRDVAWLFLNDPMGRDYPEVKFKSDYYGIIVDLFPLKINKTLKRSLKKGNKEFLEALGIEYVVENGEVFSKIDYEKFEKFMF